MKTTLYQLAVRGPDKNGTGNRIFHSKNVFLTREASEAELPDFTKRVCGEGINDLERVDESLVLALTLENERHRFDAHDKLVGEMTEYELLWTSLQWAKEQLDQGNLESAKRILKNAMEGTKK